MAEWSKALVLSTSLFGVVGSNPTVDISPCSSDGRAADCRSILVVIGGSSVRIGPGRKGSIAQLVERTAVNR